VDEEEMTVRLALPMIGVVEIIVQKSMSVREFANMLQSTNWYNANSSFLVHVAKNEACVNGVVDSVKSANQTNLSSHSSPVSWQSLSKQCASISNPPQLNPNSTPHLLFLSDECNRSLVDQRKREGETETEYFLRLDLLPRTCFEYPMTAEQLKSLNDRTLEDAGVSHQDLIDTRYDLAERAFIVCIFDRLLCFVILLFCVEFLLLCVLFLLLMF
jgi:hypothetical protein